MANGVMRLTVDQAGGKALLTTNATVFAENNLLMCLGDLVAPHGDSPHGTNPVPMVEASQKVFVGGRPVCRQGDKAQCGHPATGSSKVFFG